MAIEKCGFYLPDAAKFDYPLNLPESENLALKTKTAMEEIEEYTAELADTLPKDVYYNVSSEDAPLVLALFKVFKDIPTDVSLGIFGEIYEYFLGEFALTEGQGGGGFFTPSTVVSYMVEVLAPTDSEVFEIITSRLIQLKRLSFSAVKVDSYTSKVELAKKELIQGIKDFDAAQATSENASAEDTEGDDSIEFDTEEEN